MKILVAGLALVMSAGAVQAQELGYWRAESNTAKSITGDISFGSEKMSINFFLTTIAEIRELKGEEVASVFDVPADSGAKGKLFRVNIPASHTFLHKNKLCGSDDTEWIATYVSGRELNVAFFSGAKMPEFTRDAIANSSDLCGTFTYQR